MQPETYVYFCSSHSVKNIVEYLVFSEFGYSELNIKRFTLAI